jgi:2-hydroxychromene-2-carboxylate isomerase
MATTFAVTWDYRCPFARNAHEHLITALRSGVQWNVRFVPFSLDQAHVEEGDQPVWAHPERFPGLLANAAGVVVRDRYSDRFLDAHEALFTARHDRALDTRERAVISGVLGEVGLDGDAIMKEVDDGWPLESLRKEHEQVVGDNQVFGVPTFIAADRAVFVRLMKRPEGDAALATTTIERVLDLVTGWVDLNEFKATTIPR